MLKSPRSGFTTIEFTIASVIAILAFTSLVFVAIFVHDNITVINGVLDIGVKGRLAINKISNDARAAKTLPATHTYAGNTYVRDGDTVILGVPSINSSGNVIDPALYLDYIIYTRDSSEPTELLRIIDADTASSVSDATETVTTGVDSLAFTYYAKHMVIDITTAATLAGSPRSSKVTTSASLRNKKRGY